MTTYYYHKDRYGKERCHEVDNIAEDCKLRLELMGDNAACCVSYVWENDIFGYSSLDEYVKGECDEGPTAEFEAIDEYLGTGGSYPFCTVRHLDGTYEAMPESEVDWHELADEYEDFGHYRIQPGYYESEETTPEDAERAGMYALAAELKGEQDE